MATPPPPQSEDGKWLISFNYQKSYELLPYTFIDLLPQWAVAMISIGLLSLVCVILFGVAVVSFSSCSKVSEWDDGVDEMKRKIANF